MELWSFGRKKEEGPEWPVTEDGVPEEEAAAACYPDGQLAADSAVAMLHAMGVPARLNYPGDGVLGRIVLGSSGYGVEILVPAGRLEEAKALLETDAGAEADEESDPAGGETP